MKMYTNAETQVQNTLSKKIGIVNTDIDGKTALFTQVQFYRCQTLLALVLVLEISISVIFTSIVI